MGIKKILAPLLLPKNSFKSPVQIVKNYIYISCCTGVSSTRNSSAVEQQDLQIHSFLGVFVSL